MKREKCEIRIPRSFERSHFLHFLQLLLGPRRHGKFAYQIHAKFSSHRVGGNCVFETRLSSCRSIKRIRDWSRSGAKESCTCSFLGFLFLPPLSPSQKATAMHKTCNEDKSWHKIWQIVSEIIWQGGPKKKKGWILGGYVARLNYARGPVGQTIGSITDWHCLDWSARQSKPQASGQWRTQKGGDKKERN